MQDAAALENAWKAFERQPETGTFEAFYNASRETAARVAWRALGDVDWMEDAMQALFARLWQDRATRRIPPGLSAREALVRWTMNECRTLNRRRARTAKREAPFEAAANHPAPGQAPDEAADHRMIAEGVRRLLATLPDPYREAVLACEVEGATHAEAGNILGIPARTVQTHVRRGRELLARKLRKAGITLPVRAVLAIFAADTSAAIAWASASDIITNSSTTVTAAGAIAPSEGVAAASVFTFPAIATAAACVAGVAALVWMVSAPPGEGPADGAPSSLSGSANAVAMVMSDVLGVDETRTGTDETWTGTDEMKRAAEGEGADGITMAALEIGAEPGEVLPSSIDPPGETFPAMGRIISDATRDGIPGATIGIMLYTVDLDAGDLARFTGTEINTRGDVVTAEDGSFTIEIPESDNSEMGLFLFARADGYANQAIWLWPEIWKPLGKPTIEVALPDEGALSGRVEGPNGEALSNVVMGFPILSPFDFAPLLERGYLSAAASVTVTDSNGAFRLAGLPAGKTMELPVVHEEWPAHFEQGVLVGASGLTVTLPTRGETVRGTVSEGETPLDGWTVTFSRSNLESISDFTKALASTKSATTTRDGRYEIRGILPGVYTASATSADLKSRQAITNTIVAGHSEEINFIIDPPVMNELRFVAVDVATGEPIAGVQLATLDFHMEIPGRRPVTRIPPGTVATDQEGRATLAVEGDWIARGQVPETLLPAGYVVAPDTYCGFSKLFGFYGHRFDPDETHTIQLKRGPVLQGTVLEADGAPAGGAWVHTTTDLVGVDCDEQGRFSLTLNGVETDLVIIRSALGGVALPYPTNELAEPIEVQLQSYGMISGVFKDSTGRGISNSGLRIIWAPKDIVSTPHDLLWTFTRANGQFLFREVIPGRYLIASQIDSQIREVSPENAVVEVAPGQVIRDLEMRTTTGRFFEGVVTNDNAEPVSNALVRLRLEQTDPVGSNPPASTTMTAQSEHDGYWKLENVPEGRVTRVTFRAEGLNTHEMHIEEGDSFESPLNAMLTSFNSVSLRVVDAENGLPIPHYEYFSHAPDRTVTGTNQFQTTRVNSNDHEGLSRAFKQEEGTLIVAVFELDAGGRRTGRMTFAEFEIGGGGEQQVLELVIGEKQMVTGRVVRAMSTGPNGPLPIEGARVTVGSYVSINHALPIRKNPDLDEVVTGPDGSFTIELGPGEWQLIASKGEHYSTKVRTVLVEDSPVHLAESFDLLALSPHAN